MDVIGVPKVMPGEHIDLVHQFLLALGEGALGTFKIGSERLGQCGQLVGKLHVFNHSVDVGVDDLLNVDVFLKHESLYYRGGLLIKQLLLFQIDDDWHVSIRVVANSATISPNSSAR